MNVNSVSPVYASLYTASSLARAAAEAGQRQSAPVEPAAAQRGVSLPPEEDKGATLLLERSQYQASLNAQLGFALQPAQSLEAGSGAAGTGPGLGPVNQIVDDLRDIQGRSGAESSEAVERPQDVTGQGAETAALSAGTVAATQPIADERVVLTQTDVSLSGLLDQVTRVLSGALGELLGDALRAQGPTNPAQPNSRSNATDRRIDLYRNLSLSRASRLDAKE